MTPAARERVRAAALAETEGESAPWIAWFGGNRPHSPMTAVEVQLRSGSVQRVTSAFVPWYWSNEADDVVAYRERSLPPSDVPFAEHLALLDALEAAEGRGANLLSGLTALEDDLYSAWLRIDDDDADEVHNCLTALRELISSPPATSGGQADG